MVKVVEICVCVREGGTNLLYVKAVVSLVECTVQKDQEIEYFMSLLPNAHKKMAVSNQSLIDRLARG